MPMHRLNYGSIKIDWDPPTNNPGIGRVRINCRCVCGKLLIGEGTTFVGAAKLLDRRLFEHAAAAESDGPGYKEEEAS
jgi:hypothetical protein